MKKKLAFLALITSALSLTAQASDQNDSSDILLSLTIITSVDGVSSSDSNDDKIIAELAEDDAKHFLLTGESTEALNEAIEFLKGNNEDLALADAHTVAQKIVAQAF